MQGKLCRVDRACDFFLAEHLRQVQNLLRIRRFGKRSSRASTPVQKKKRKAAKRCVTVFWASFQRVNSAA